MIAICPNCANHEWDKEVRGDEIFCPKCGAHWGYNKMPVYILTGCSGVGKTTTGMALQKLTTDYVVLDGDMFYNIMPHDTDEDYYAQIEQAFSLSKNIMQSGKPVVWMKAGNIDKLPHTYNKRFFTSIRVLALTCSEAELRRRMTEGRGIDNEDWIEGSVGYNEYFRTHNAIGETTFDTLDTDGRSVREVAEAVLRWLQEQRENE